MSDEAAAPTPLRRPARPVLGARRRYHRQRAGQPCAAGCLLATPWAHYLWLPGPPGSISVNSHLVVHFHVLSVGVSASYLVVNVVIRGYSSCPAALLGTARQCKTLHITLITAANSYRSSASVQTLGVARQFVPSGRVELLAVAEGTSPAPSSGAGLMEIASLMKRQSSVSHPLRPLSLSGLRGPAPASDRAATAQPNVLRTCCLCTRRGYFTPHIK